MQAKKQKKTIPPTRVFVRPPTPGDRSEFLRLTRASRRIYGRLVTPPTTPREYDRYLERLATGRHAAFFICRRQDGAIVGVINVNEIIRGNAQSAFLGWSVGAPYAGKGYMTEGLNHVLHRVFRKMKLHRVEAHIRTENVRSIAMARRCGFVREGLSRRYLKTRGRWRDYERWALLAEDWHARELRRRQVREEAEC
jgi:ribosomal-protein-alanine N-acetyltransferase